jgi:hypothetical protein
MIKLSTACVKQPDMKDAVLMPYYVVATRDILIKGKRKWQTSRRKLRRKGNKKAAK